MMGPRFSISGLMALVLLMAVDLATIRFVLSGPVLPPPLADLLLIGALPMANVLAIGAIALARPGAWTGRDRRREALVGFEAGGSAAWLTYLGLCLMLPREVHAFFPMLLSWTPLSPSPLLATCIGGIILLSQLAAGFAVARLIRGPSTPTTARSASNQARPWPDKAARAAAHPEACGDRPPGG